MTPEEFLQKFDWMGRFKYSVQTIKDNKTIWVLKASDGSYPISEGRPKKFCVWAEESHARYECTDGREDTLPTPMSYEDFMSEIYPVLKKRKVNIILVSPMRNRRGKEVSLSEFIDKIGMATDADPNKGIQVEPAALLTPIDKKILKGLFDYLDEALSIEECNNDLRLTIAYLRDCGVRNIDNAVAWLQSKGGYCDCEVLANVEE